MTIVEAGMIVYSDLRRDLGSNRDEQTGPTRQSPGRRKLNCFMKSKSQREGSWIQSATVLVPSSTKKRGLYERS